MDAIVAKDFEFSIGFDIIQLSQSCRLREKAWQTPMTQTQKMARTRARQRSPNSQTCLRKLPALGPSSAQRAPVGTPVQSLRDLLPFRSFFRTGRAVTLRRDRPELKAEPLGLATKSPSR